MKKVQGFTWNVGDHELLSATDTWGDTLCDLARYDSKIVCVTADLGTTTKLARFRREHPDRFFNVGIAEQNLMAVAAGLAAAGFTPVVCTYATFASLRAAEFVRTDIAYGGRNVKILATLAGVTFGQGGPTHHSVEDLALMRAIPGLTVLVPSDGEQMCGALAASLAHDGPVYLRYGRGTEPSVPHPPFAIGPVQVLREGTDVTVFACGPCVHAAIGAADRAARLGIHTKVVAVQTLDPPDVAGIRLQARATRRVITVEDHSVRGGLGGAVAEAIVGMACVFRRLGHPDHFLPMGVPEDLMHLGGFDDDGIYAAICDIRQVEPEPDEQWEDRF